MLAANTAGTTITASYNAATETLTLTGLRHAGALPAGARLGDVRHGERQSDQLRRGAEPHRDLDAQRRQREQRRPRPRTRRASRRSTTRRRLRGAANASFTENGGGGDAVGRCRGHRSGQPTLVGATVAISRRASLDGDVLAATTTGTTITASYNAATEMLTLSGTDTLAHYQQVLDSVTFASTQRQPDQLRRRPQPHHQLDGQRRQRSATAPPRPRTVNITAVNDAPVARRGGDASTTPSSGTGRRCSSRLTVERPDNTTLRGARCRSARASSPATRWRRHDRHQHHGELQRGTGMLTLTGTDTLAHYQQVLDASRTPRPATTRPTSAPTPAARSLGGQRRHARNSTTATTTVNVTAVERRAGARRRGGDAPPTAQNAAPVTLSSAATVTDADNLTLASRHGVDQRRRFSTGDMLASPTGTSITASYNAAPGCSPSPAATRWRITSRCSTRHLLLDQRQPDQLRHRYQPHDHLDGQRRHAQQQRRQPAR